MGVEARFGHTTMLSTMEIRWGWDAGFMALNSKKKGGTIASK